MVSLKDTFTLFEPIFYFLVALAIVMLILALMPKTRSKLFAIIYAISNLVLIILLYMTEGIIVEQYNLIGDETTFALGIISVTLSILTVYFAFRKREKIQK